MKRYTVTMEFYIFEDGDDAAKNEAERIAARLRAKKDNQAKVHEIHETPLGSLKPRKIK